MPTCPASQQGPCPPSKRILFPAERWKNTALITVCSCFFHKPPIKTTHDGHIRIVCCKLYPGRPRCVSSYQKRRWNHEAAYQKSGVCRIYGRMPDALARCVQLDHIILNRRNGPPPRRRIRLSRMRPCLSRIRVLHPERMQPATAAQRMTRSPVRTVTLPRTALPVRTALPARIILPAQTAARIPQITPPALRTAGRNKLQHT